MFLEQNLLLNLKVCNYNNNYNKIQIVNDDDDDDIILGHHCFFVFRYTNDDIINIASSFSIKVKP